jgi:hypothetical protein
LQIEGGQQGVGTRVIIRCPLATSAA